MNISPQTLRCLLVDDDPCSLLILQQQLSALGVKDISQCNNAAQALDKLQSENSFDIIFSDLNMPYMDGIELVRHLHTRHIPSALVLVSGEDPNIMTSIARLAKNKGLQILGSMEKPIERKQLQTLLHAFDPSFSPHMQEPAPQVSLEELQVAISEKQIDAYFQPQICLKTGEVVGAEALAHWHHPEYGDITAEHFVPLAEQHNLIQLISHLMLHSCCRQLQHWKRQGLDITLSLNISPLNLDRLDLPDILCNITDRYDIKPQQLIIELTESCTLADLHKGIDILSRLRLKGFQLSIDDYGTGYSSLEKLRQIPFTELKIDKSFIHSAEEHPHGRKILESTIELAKKLNLKCVAEGVQERKDWDLVHELGCDIAQGYYISRALSASNFLSWAVNQNQRKHRA